MQSQKREALRCRNRSITWLRTQIELIVIKEIKNESILSTKKEGIITE